MEFIENNDIKINPQLAWRHLIELQHHINFRRSFKKFGRELGQKVYENIYGCFMQEHDVSNVDSGKNVRAISRIETHGDEDDLFKIDGDVLHVSPQYERLAVELCNNPLGWLELRNFLKDNSRGQE